MLILVLCFVGFLHGAEARSKSSSICVEIGFFTIRVSVRLSDRSSYREEQKKFVKNCPQLGLNPGPLIHHSNVLLTVLGRCVLSRRFLK